MLQYPVGYLSDRFGRRSVLLVLLLISIVTSFIVTQLPLQEHFLIILLLTAIAGGIIACTYPMSISQVFDQLEQNQMIAAMGKLILAYSLGGALGPYSTSVVMNVFGSQSLFYFLTAVQLILVVFVAYRMMIRDPLPIDEQEDFVMQTAVITPPVQLDPRVEYVEQPTGEQ